MSDPLLRVRNLGVEFGRQQVMSDVNFDLFRGETLGLVGESGSGKSTLARAILRLLPAHGSVEFSGENLLLSPKHLLRARRRNLQIVFQDPLASLNPRMRVSDAIAEPLKIFESGSAPALRRRQVAGMLERVGLAADLASRYPHELSGGQCQRVAIARAMILRPALLICDEAVSSLDVSIQGQIVNLLLDLQSETGMAMLFISHNLAVVRHLCRRVLVMYCGKLVEIADCDALFAAPLHPYTQALLAAVPRIEHTPGPGTAILATAEQSARAASGCAFRYRCAFALPICASREPPLEEAAGGHWAACHRSHETLNPLS